MANFGNLNIFAQALAGAAKGGVQGLLDARDQKAKKIKTAQEQQLFDLKMKTLNQQFTAQETDKKNVIRNNAIKSMTAQMNFAKTLPGGVTVSMTNNIVKQAIKAEILPPNTKLFANATPEQRQALFTEFTNITAKATRKDGTIDLVAAKQGYNDVLTVFSNRENINVGSFQPLIKDTITQATDAAAQAKATELRTTLTGLKDANGNQLLNADLLKNATPEDLQKFSNLINTQQVKNFGTQQKDAQQFGQNKITLLNAKKLDGTPLLTPEQIQSLNFQQTNDIIKQINTQQVKSAITPPKPTGDKQSVPDERKFRDPQTNDVRFVNVREPAAIVQARKDGFIPISAGDTAFLKKQGFNAAETQKEILDNGDKEQGKVATLESMQNLLDRIETGKLANIETQLQSWSKAFGVNINTAGLAAKEAFTAFSNQLALQARNQGPGMVLAGSMSNRDVKFLQAMNPQLILSKAGNRLILKMRIKMSQRQVKVTDLVNEFKKQNRGIFDQTKFRVFTKEKLGNISVFDIPEGAIFTNATEKQTGLPLYQKINNDTGETEFFAPAF